MASTSTIVSWGVILAVGAGGYWYYTQGPKPQVLRGRSTSVTEGPPTKSAKREARARRKPEPVGVSEASGSDAPFNTAVEHDSSATEQARKRKKGKGTPLNLNAAPEIKVKSNDGDNDSKFAESMLRAKEGTKLAPPAKHSSRTKTVKTSGMGHTSPDFSSTSSTGGADADGELSPAISPGLRAAGDVSDMLEPAPTGPSILRLTEDPNKPAPRQKQAPKEYQVAETKKQRQNKAKNEARKAADAGVEADRQKLLEQQRRTAREARGEPARNGMQQAKAPSSSAWIAKEAGSVRETHAAPPVAPLLDTFDRSEAPAVGNAQASVVPQIPVTANGGPKDSQYSNGMAEQTQIQMATQASQDQSGWNEVPAKKGKTKPAGPIPGVKSNGEKRPAAQTNGSVTGRYAGLEVDE